MIWRPAAQFGNLAEKWKPDSFRYRHHKGNHDGYETVQIYLRDIYAEVARPVKELKGFDRIFLKKGESREVKFVLTEDDLKFYNSGLQYIYEPGEFDVMIGTNSRDVQTKRFIAE